MSMLDWAKNEIEIACKFENPDWDGKEFDYGCACYQSALKAYECLMEDGHSGTSFGFTKNILIRLMEGLPLRPIEDKDFFNHANGESALPLTTEEHLKEQGLKSDIQCPRMYSLFREETLDGIVRYSDNDRQYCINIHNPSDTFHNGTGTNIINELFPIAMPYSPSNKKYKIYVEEFLTDKRNGDYDTQGFLYCITPEGERVELNRFFGETSEGWKEIDEEEYERRKEAKLFPFCDEK